MRKLTMSELNRMDVEEYRNVEKLPIVIVLDNIRSLSNVGSFFRTADAFRIETLFLCGITACPPHREIHKTALGADDSVQWRYFKTTVEACECLKNAGYSVFAVEQVENSIMLDDFIVPQKSAYILVMKSMVLTMFCCHIVLRQWRYLRWVPNIRSMYLSVPA